MSDALSAVARLAQEQARKANGQFGAQAHSTPEVAVTPPLTEAIAGYLRDYDSALEDYQDSDTGGFEDAGAYEAWEDFQTDNSRHAYDMLASAKVEIERLQEELRARDEQAAARYTVPKSVEEFIINDLGPRGEEAALFVPDSGFDSDEYVDVVAVHDGEPLAKYTRDPEGAIHHIWP